MSEKSNSNQPEVYEFMNPGARFVSLAREIMRQHHQDPDASLDEEAISVYWPAQEKGNHYVLQKKYVQNGRGMILTAYILERFTADYSSTKPSERYFVATDENNEAPKTSTIYQIDHKDLPIIHIGDVAKWQRRIARTALHALGEQAPDYANQLITQQFDQHFNNAVADYILSDYAIVGTDQELTSDIVRESLTHFHERTQNISNSAVEKSKKHGPNGGTASNAYTKAVRDAAKHARTADDRNRYQTIDYAHIVPAAAKQIIRWQHLVSSKDIFGKGREEG